MLKNMAEVVWLRDGNSEPFNTRLHIRKGVLFQNLPPLNGRELTAADVAYSLNRLIKSPGAVMNTRPYHRNP